MATLRRTLCPYVTYLAAISGDGGEIGADGVGDAGGDVGDGGGRQVVAYGPFDRKCDWVAGGGAVGGERQAHSEDGVGVEEHWVLERSAAGI